MVFIGVSDYSYIFYVVDFSIIEVINYVEDVFVYYVFFDGKFVVFVDVIIYII